MTGWLYLLFVCSIILSIVTTVCIGTLGEDWRHWGRKHQPVRMAVLCCLIFLLATWISLGLLSGGVIFK